MISCGPYRTLGGAAEAPDRCVGEFDQAELDFIDRQRLARQCVEVTQGVGGQLGIAAIDGKALIAPADADIEAGFDLPDVLVQRPA